MVVALAVGSLLAGCAEGDATGDGAAVATPSSPPPSTMISSTDYLPVPDGVELTEPGSEMDLKDDAVVAWRPRQDVVGVLDLSVGRLEETTVERSLAGFRLSADVRESTPYFVRAVVTNDGDSDLGGRQVPLYAIDSSGRLIEPTGVDNDFADCPDGVLPAIFAPGDRARTCLIFFVPPGASLESVMFRPPEGVVPLTWSGEIRIFGERTPRTKRSKDDGGDGGDDRG